MSRFKRTTFKTIAANAGDTSTTHIAARTGLDRGHVSRLLKGNSEPNLDTVCRIAEAYRTDLESLVQVAAAA
jgi:transcriptional regulator with XRE-family HTH domain